MPVVEGFVDLVEVGRGGFSRVFGAYQVAFDRRVALKVLNERLADDASVAAFERECQAMGGLSRHPFIVTVLASAFTSDYRPCIVMDLFEQGNYMGLLRRDGPLPLEELLSLSVRVAGALATAHQDGVIHGDVKPQNIFKSSFGYPALGDFGIATLRSRLVDSAGLGLSPHYAAPELIDIGAGAVGAAADQYSLGATIYTLAVGRRPFESDHHEAPQQVLARALSAPTPTLPESFPRDLTSVLRRAMAREPQDRFPDLTAFAVALANIEHRLGHRPTAIPIASIDDDATITVDNESHWVLWRLGLLVSNQCTVGLSGSVGLFELCWRGVAEVAVEALGVVPVHPAQGGEFDVVDAAPRPLGRSADEFGLVEAVDGLGEGVVVGIAHRAD